MKILPIRGLMSAQRPGQSLSASTLSGGRSHIFYSGPLGYDYLTQLPSGEHELMFGGGAAQGGQAILPEVGNTDDGGYNMDIATHVAGALSEYFGAVNWGAEGQPAALPEHGNPSEGERSQGGPVRWNEGRVKALWTGILGISTDGLPWVGRVPSVVSGRSVPPPTSVSTAKRSSSLKSEKQNSENSVDGRRIPLTAEPGEWMAAGYSGEGMVHAWMSGRALAYMVLGVEEETRLVEWFPGVLGITEKRWKNATLERLLDRL